MERIKNTAAELARLLVELIAVMLTGEEWQPDRRPPGRHSRRGRQLVPAGWSPLSLEVRRQLAPYHYAEQPA